MENYISIRSYFNSRLRKQYNKGTTFINPLRFEQVKRIRDKSFDYIIYGIDINVITLAKKLIKQGKTCLLLSSNDFVDFQPNLIISLPLSVSYLYIFARGLFKKEEQILLKEYLKIYNENIWKFNKQIDQEENRNLKIDISHLLFYQRLYFVLLNNILMYKIGFKNSYLNFTSEKVYSNQPYKEINNIIMNEITKLALENRGK